MGRRSGGRKLPFFASAASTSSTSKRTRSARRLPSLPKPASPPPPYPTSPPPAPQTTTPPPSLSAAASGGAAGSGKVMKKKAGARLWMRLDRWGSSEILELDKASIIQRAGVPPRDLRILGPIFSHSSSILAREKAMVINLEFIRAIVTAEEVLLLDPLAHEVLPFVDQLRQHLPLRSLVGGNGGDGHGEKQDGSPGNRVPCLNEATGAEHELPFEFQVLEVGLEALCSTLDLSVADLERHAIPVLDELTKNVSQRNLERVRSLKSDLTRLLARVQKVRDEIEHLLDDNEDMAHLYLTRKQTKKTRAGARGGRRMAEPEVPADVEEEEEGPEEIVQIGAQKHDPAWKHCVMVRSAGRVRLKCAYCAKHFLGGGIHRFKEHLARRPGNACCCPCVPQDVEALMHRSLEEVAAKKLRKRSLAAAAAGSAAYPVAMAHNGTAAAQVQLQVTGDMASPIHMVPLSQVLDPRATPSSEMGWSGDTATATASKRRKKALVVRRASSSATPPAPQHHQQQPLQPAAPQPQPQPQQQSVMGLDAAAPRHSDPAGSDKDKVSMAVGRFLYDAGVPLEAVNSVHFQPMIDAIASTGGRPEVFSYHDFRGCVLNKSLDEVTAQLEFYKGSWTRTGCSVLADEWTTDKGRALINFSVYCPEGTMFLKSVDGTGIVTSADALYELLKSVVEEVGVEYVVQVITKNSEVHAAAGEMLGETFPTLFWSPCSFLCIDGMLEDFSKVKTVSDIIGHAKAITGFIYNNAVALSLMKKYLHGKDLLVPAETRAAMNFVTLKNMYSLKEELQAMVNSDEWIYGLCVLPKNLGGVETSNIVNNLQIWSFWDIVVRATEPLVHLLKLVSSNKRPAMGYVYAGLYRAKAAIKKELVRKSDYMPYWNIIDQRWDKHTPRPLYSAGFFLNPLFFDGIRGDISSGIFSGMLDCIERLVSDVKIQDKIQKELNMYRKEAVADFRRQIAIRARRTLPPAEWWYTYGGACPNLTRLAVRILSQTCSAKGCDRTHIPFEQIHDERMNNFERQRMRHLTFVQCNLRLQHRQQYKAKAFDPVSVDNIDIVDDWVVDRSVALSGPIEQPNFNLNWVAPAVQGDEFESFIEGVDDEMIQGASRGTQDDDDDGDDSQDDGDGNRDDSKDKENHTYERIGFNLDRL